MTAEQLGYDTMAQTYADLIPDTFQSPLEKAAVDAFASEIRGSNLGSTIVDVGCGIGHVAAYLTDAGFTVLAVDPSTGMREQAELAHPDLELSADDASLSTVDLSAVAGVVARYSLIHVAPDGVREALADWASRLPSGACILLAGQSSDEPGVSEFDHAVAPAWRWHPDSIAEAVTDVGFTELWRTVSRPAEGFHRFPEFHLCARTLPGNSGEFAS
ncbi:class I SAM-dependent methyltransferase [Gordonia sp. PDNC005]|uniref:class I SAM-dependent methyltransferase n=1 Tax=unclassified Gordonia (in: high G+C Gram-positive bacteria) TaxID=2657482 RepID=UPI001963A179|nr:class I SAM-dependent methyltransferase [Gordonia sp. PDNC005]QRY62121.1 class I SAM-dependent methyltransferase [Gordonia sp. PDNC005]